MFLMNVNDEPESKFLYTETMKLYCIVVIIIMYIYHALINALSAHMIHVNLNIIFYTHVEQYSIHM